MDRTVTLALREYFSAPPHIEACASAVRYDLLHGPTWAVIPEGGIEAFTQDDFATFASDLEGEAHEVYTGPIAAALRDWIDDLSIVYVSEDDVMTGEPQGEWLDADFEPCDSDAEGAQWFEPDPYYVCGPRDIARALFGDTIADEFR